MKQFVSIFWACLLLCITQCSQSDSVLPEPDEPKVYTGNEVTYFLQSASEFNIFGTVTLKEKTDSTTTVSIALNGINEVKDIQCPVHLHYGNIATDAADVAAILEPVSSKTGKSETNLQYLSDESYINFSALKKLNACIKIHLSNSGEGRNIILSAGNIGEAAKNSSAVSGRLRIGICRSN